MTEVKLRALCKRYPNGFEAVKGVDLEVRSGELIALVGPSGCGKSTTLRMVAGLEEISGGELLIGGERMNERPPRDRGVGMVFQSYALYPHMSAFENIAFALKLQKTPQAELERRVRAVAERLEISELLSRKPKQMSGGQRQRIAIARALIREPKVLLFDEPLSNLDAQLRAHMRVELSALHAEMGATSLYVTHDQVEAMTLADRIVLLRSGEVQQIGAPLELHDDPNNLFVASFIGSPSMNLTVLSAEALSLLCPELPEEAEASLKQAGALSVGVRPHHLALCEASELDQRRAEGRCALSAQVELVEPLGSETLIYCLSELPSGLTWRLTARVEGRSSAVRGDLLGLHCDPSSLRFFSADEEGRRLR